MEIEIIVKENDEVWARKTANSWESAEENFGKLEQAWKTKPIILKEDERP